MANYTYTHSNQNSPKHQEKLDYTTECQKFCEIRGHNGEAFLSRCTEIVIPQDNFYIGVLVDEIDNSFKTGNTADTAFGKEVSSLGI